LAIEDLDGVVAAPDHHVVLFENDAVRVLETTIGPGDVTPLHTHRAPTVSYVVSGSHLLRRDQDGMTLLDTRSDPDFVLPRVLYSAGLPPHTLENPGPDELVIIGIELKQPQR